MGIELVKSSDSTEHKIYDNMISIRGCGMNKKIICTIILLSIPSFAGAHGGGLNSEGCHNDRKRGTYHCHRSSYTPKSASSFSSSRSSSFTNYNKASNSAKYNNTKISSIQTLLKHNGYNVGAVDGKFGTKTRKAIESFQRDNRLIVTGLPTDQLILELSNALK